MKKYGKAMAYTGTILVWLPIVLMLLTGIVGSISEKRLLVDYLMPAELFFLALIGGFLLVVVSRLAGRLKKSVLLSFLVMIAALAGSQGAAVWSGIASGETEAAGAPWIMVLCLLGLYIAMVVVQGILGMALIRSDPKSAKE